MAIQWFPGHMHLTRKAIGERITEIDVVIEMLDARLPGSSANPMLAELIQGKPALKVLSKQDLADPARTALWLAHYNAMPGVRAIGLDTSMTSPAKALIEACQQLAPNRGGMAKPMHVLICGIPNVGKSTLINTLKGKRATKTGDEAGVTKIEQRITLADDFYLYDTPGVLWPRIIVEQSGFNLAASGAIGVNAFDEEVVALELLNYIIPLYPEALQARYKIVRINLTKTAHLVIHDFRTAALGRLTLETPQEFAQWLTEGKKADAERAVRKEAIEKNKPKKKPRQ
jgi:ribosome biogenesis GTPase A